MGISEPPFDPQVYADIIKDYINTSEGLLHIPSGITTSWEPSQPTDVWGNVQKAFDLLGGKAFKASEAFKKLSEFTVEIDLDDDTPFDPDHGLQDWLRAAQELADHTEAGTHIYECDFYDGPWDGATRELPPDGQSGKPPRFWTVPVFKDPKGVFFPPDSKYPTHVEMDERVDYERFAFDDVTGHWQYWPRGHTPDEF